MDAITDMKVYQNDDGQVCRFLWQKFSESVKRAAGRLRVPLPTPWERRMRGLYFSAMDGDEAAWFTRELQETLVRVFRETDCAGDGNAAE